MNHPPKMSPQAREMGGHAEMSNRQIEELILKLAEDAHVARSDLAAAIAAVTELRDLVIQLMNVLPPEMLAKVNLVKAS